MASLPQHIYHKSLDDWRSFSNPDPEFEELLRTLPETPKLSGTIDSLRTAQLERKKALTATLSSGISDVTEIDITVLARDGYQIPVRVYQSPNFQTGGTAAAVMLHGGGFCIGGLSNEELNCRNFVSRLGVTSFNVDYRLAPEHPYPVPVNGCWDVLKWIAKHASDFNISLDLGFIVGGTSAGGNIAAVLGLMARDEGLHPPLTGLLLITPCLLSERAVPEKYREWYQSYAQNSNAPILSTSAFEYFVQQYRPVEESWRFNPVNHPKGHSNLPPFFFQICGGDPLRDEGLIYEKILREDFGGITRLAIYQGLPHGFYSFFPNLKVSHEFIEDTIRGAQWLIEQGGSNATIKAATS